MKSTMPTDNPAPATPDPAAQAVTKLITCWKLTLLDGAVAGFTSNTEALLIDGLLYKATTILALSNIVTTDDFSMDNLDVTALLSNVDIKEQDILAGRYDYAEIEVFTAHLDDLRSEDKTKCAARVIQRRGWLGEIAVHDGKFTTEVRGLAQKLQCNIGEIYSPSCRATFGDGRCKVKIADYTHDGVVSKVDTGQRQIFAAQSMSKPDGYFAFGELKWLSGDNAGLKMEIKEFTNIDNVSAQFVLAVAMPQPIKVEDKFEAVAGCDKVFATCCNRFKNAVNFRGEPHVPGKTRLGEVPDTG